MLTIWKNPHLDGVVDYCKYVAPKKPRILWILKEPSGKNENGPCNYREKLKNIGKLTTYGRILQVSYGIFCENDSWNNSLQLKRDKWGVVIGENDEVVLDEIAVININKVGGGKSTPEGAMLREYQRPGIKDFLFRQIELIDPQIIINAHQVEDFFKDQIFNRNEPIKVNDESFIDDGKRLIINTLHPNNRKTSKKRYCNNLLKIVQENAHNEWWKRESI